MQLSNKYTTDAHRQYRKKDYNSTLSLCNKAIEANPRNTLPYRYRCAYRTNLKDYKGALDDVSKVIEIDPSYNESYLDKYNLIVMRDRNFSSGTEFLQENSEAIKKGIKCNTVLGHQCSIAAVGYSLLGDSKTSILAGKKYIATKNTLSDNYKEAMKGSINNLLDKSKCSNDQEYIDNCSFVKENCQFVKDFFSEEYSSSVDKIISEAENLSSDAVGMKSLRRARPESLQPAQNDNNKRAKTGDDKSNSMGR